MSRTQKDFAPRKEQLIQIALDLFLEKGYEQTTITDLQRAFELTKGGMYHYFSSKEEILDAVIEKGLGYLITEWREHIAALPAEEWLIYILFCNEANSFSSRMIRLSRLEGSSFVALKLREQRLKMPIPLVTEIIRQYVSSGFYTCDYPEEMAEILILLAVTFGDYGISSNEKQRNRIENVISIWNNCVKPPESHIIALRENLHRFYEERATIND